MYNYLKGNKISCVYFDSLASVKLFLMECEKDDRIRWSAGQNPLYEYHHFAENDLFPTYEKLHINCYYYLKYLSYYHYCYYSHLLFLSVDILY